MSRSSGKTIGWVVALFFLSVPLSFALDVAEVPRPEISPLSFEVINKVENDDTIMAAEKLRLVNEALQGTRSAYGKFNLIFWGASFLYAEQEQYEESLRALKTGQAEGLFYPLMTGQQTWPPYLNQFQHLENYTDFLTENERLKQTASHNARFEYIVRLPEGYSINKSYPLLMVLHGGFGSHIELSERWLSPKLKSEVIVAYMQGSLYRGSFLRSYDAAKQEHFVEAFEQISENYSVDPSRVILSGQSAGAGVALELVLDERLPATRLFFTFPSILGELDEPKLRAARDRRLRVAMIVGGKDVRFERQMAISATLDRIGVQNSLVVFPDVGHGFPDDFPTQLDIALNYLLETP